MAALSRAASCLTRRPQVQPSRLQAARAMASSLFGHVEPAPKDPILGVTEAYLADPSPDKMNVGVVSVLGSPRRDRRILLLLALLARGS